MKEPPVGYDGYVAGKLYSVSMGGVIPYRIESCPLTGVNCKETCVLYVDGKCRYKLSFDDDDVYRKVDNMLLFDKIHPQSSTQPIVEQPTGKPALVVGVDALREVVPIEGASQCFPSIPPPPISSTEDEVDKELENLRVKPKGIDRGEKE